MNPSDDDLDLLIKTWTVPRSPDSLQARLRSAYKDRARTAARQQKSSFSMWVRWIDGIVPIAVKFTGVFAASVVLLAVIARGFPQSLLLVAPPATITLEAEFRDYKDDGSYTVSEYRASYWASPFPEGGETLLSRSFPGDPLRSAAEDIFSPVRVRLERIAHRTIDPLFHRPGRVEYSRAAAIALTDRIRNGCTTTNMHGRPMTVIGEETILNYTTTVSRLTYEEANVRLTEWFAPGLDCLSLRSTTEKAQADGTFRLVRERRVLKVTRN